MLEFVEGSLDKIAGFVDLFVISTLDLSVAFWWDKTALAFMQRFTNRTIASVSYPLSARTTSSFCPLRRSFAWVQSAVFPAVSLNLTDIPVPSVSK